MPDENGLKVVIQWMSKIDDKLENIHSELSNKVDRTELQIVEKKVDSANKKINRITGAWGILTAGVAAFFEFK